MTKKTTMTRTQVRKLLAAGASVRTVLMDAGVRQQQVAEACGSQQGRVAKVLAGDVGATAEGRATALRIFEAVAQLLGIPVGTIPAAKQLTTRKEA